MSSSSWVVVAYRSGTDRAEVSFFGRYGSITGSARKLRRQEMRPNKIFKRFMTNMSDPEMRAKVLALAGGKAIGLTLLLTAMRIFLAPVLSAQAPAALPPPEINAINTAWTLIAA